MTFKNVSVQNTYRIGMELVLHSDSVGKELEKKVFRSHGAIPKDSGTNFLSKACLLDRFNYFLC